MSEEKNNVTPFPVKEEDPRELTKEEIDYIMKQDESELDGYLSKFKQLPQPDTSKIEEEEEEDEEFTLDFDTGKAYQKMGEGIITQDEEGNVNLVEDEEVAEQIKKMIENKAEPLKPTLQQKYQDMITNRLVSKALASLMERLNNVQKEAEEVANKAGLSYIGERTADGMYESIQKQKNEIRKAWSGTTIRYDEIPEWATMWIDDYIQNGLNTLLDFVERD